MTPAQLDALLHAQKKDGEHGTRNCPKCHQGYMAYVVTAASGVYSCVKCHWLEIQHGPWPDRSQT
jgi:ribosomal protein L37AE/L43A